MLSSDLAHISQLKIIPNQRIKRIRPSENGKMKRQ
jgi:hypothetical protein